MAPANSRFGGQNAGTTYARLPPITLPTNTPGHHSSNSGSLPPPSYHHAFDQQNPFAPPGNLNGLAGGFGPGGGLGDGGTGLGSREARMGFQHGAELQQQQQIKEHMRREGGMGPKGQLKSRIRDVWRGNLSQEMGLLRAMVDRYSYISMVCQVSLRSRSVYSLLWINLGNFRILSSLVSSLDLWALSLLKQTTTTKPYVAMSISSK